MSETTYIYVLKDPETGLIRYLGKSDRPARRLGVHCADKKRNHRTNWIQSLLKRGLRPVLEILDEVPSSQWIFWEREYIRVFRVLNIPLVNDTDGGEGSCNPSAETLEKRRQKMLGSKNPNFGKPLPGWHREIVRQARAGRPLSEETKEKQRRAARANNTSGVPGVRHNKKANTFRASLMVNGTRHYLGSFSTLVDAANVREMALAAAAEAASQLKKGMVDYV